MIAVFIAVALAMIGIQPAFGSEREWPVGPLTAAPAAANTPSLSGATFQAGSIITDQIFYNSAAMSAAQIQQFLSAKYAGCSANYVCVRDYTATTPNQPATTGLCNAYAGAPNETAATIIAKVAASCGVNPQSLLVLIQKESGLITDQTPDYTQVTGFGCPDSTGCDAQYYGFFNQVYLAARQFKRYRLNPTNYGYVAGRTNYIPYNPNAACGGSQVYITNQATAGLYDYTPYQPNGAALSNLRGTGDSCSTYGNRNFWVIFNDWFGSPNGPIGSLDSVSQTSGGVLVAGWALDAKTTGSIRVDVYADGVGLGGTIANQSRPDVSPLGYGSNHGFSAGFPLGVGNHTVCAYGIDSAGGANTTLGCRQIAVIIDPIGSLDSVSQTPGGITVSGWALDADTPDPIRVDVYADGVGLGSTMAASARADIAFLGHGTAHGFSAAFQITQGAHTVCAYGIDVGPGVNSTLGCRQITVNFNPIGSLDSVAPATGGATISGWALDPDSTSPIMVAVYADGIGLGTTTAAAVRPDLAFLGQGTAHGFSASVTLGRGTHTVCTYALNVGPGANILIGCSSVAVTQ